MARPKSVADLVVVDAILRRIAGQGDRSVSFGTIGRDVGLAPATLVQRCGTRDAMVTWALAAAWDQRRAEAAETLETAEPGEKGAAAALKSLAQTSSALPLRDLLALSAAYGCDEKAGVWRELLQRGIARLLRSDPEIAAMIVTAWVGQLTLEPFGPKVFRLRAMIRRLA
jgi:hypothetical protein